MFTAALWGVTIILPELQMRKQRHRRVKSFLTDTLPAHGKAGIYLQTFLLQRPSSNMRAQLPPRPTCHSAAEDEDDSAGHKQEVSTALPSGFARWIIQGNLWKIQSPESESPEVRAISVFTTCQAPSELLYTPYLVSPSHKLHVCDTLYTLPLVGLRKQRLRETG